MSASAKRENKTSAENYLTPPDRDMWQIIVPLMMKKERTGYEIAVAVLYDGKEFKIVKSYFSRPKDVDHPLDTPIANLMLHACQDFHRKLFIVATCEPTIFEHEAINIMGIDRVFYPISKKEFVLLVQKNRSLQKQSFVIPENVVLQLEAADLVSQVHAKIEAKEIKAIEKGRLNTCDSFLWCEDLKSVDCSQPFQDELYIGLLYSSLFILWNETARPIDHTGRFPVAAMLVDGDNKPIAFSINTSKADNSMAHAETGMLLRYFNSKKVKSLPAGSKLYTTLESCEMCRAGLSIVKDSKSEFKELYGKKDNKVKCRAYAGYSLSSYAPSNVHLQNIDLKRGNHFYDFCRANYLAIKSFLKDKSLKEKSPQLFENIEILWGQIIRMRMKPWVGNPILYDLQGHPLDSSFLIAKQKPNFKELYTFYYGKNIGEFIIEERAVYSKGLTIMGRLTSSGDIDVGTDAPVVVRIGDGSSLAGKIYAAGSVEMGDGSSILGGLYTSGSIKMGNRSSISGGVHISGGVKMYDGASIRSDGPILIPIHKDEVKRQLQIRTGFPLDEKKLMGEYTPTFEDECLKMKLFPLSVTEQIHEQSLQWWSKSNIMEYLTECYQINPEWFKENLSIDSHMQLEVYSITKLIWTRDDGNHREFRERVYCLFSEFGESSTYSELVQLVKDHLPQSGYHTAHPSSLVDHTNVTAASIHSRRPGIGLHSSVYPTVVTLTSDHVASARMKS